MSDVDAGRCKEQQSRSGEQCRHLAILAQRRVIMGGAGLPTVSAASRAASYRLDSASGQAPISMHGDLVVPSRDQSDGKSAGSVVNSTTNGGTTAYSTNADSATLTVTRPSMMHRS